MLSTHFEKNVIKLDKSPEQIVTSIQEQISKKDFDLKVKEEVIGSLNQLNTHQEQMKQQWDSLALPN